MSFDDPVDFVRGAVVPDAGNADGAADAPEPLTSDAAGAGRSSFTDGGGSNGATVSPATADGPGAEAAPDSVVTCRPAMKSK